MVRLTPNGLSISSRQRAIPFAGVLKEPTITRLNAR
ncbi:hypothetical protein EDD35_1005 [Amycolatopsis thermoflava]|uniref:Uncharacterized protein n=1 Tax=Amycolatopsis thermoflava TaxID=84480 RepID=A0A3N2GR56_9PSEU|nr:hypothetical protein EDD35_1005 [Amycolatopsis thermoflava]